MDDSRALRLAGWAGIVFSVLSLIVLPFALFSLPPPFGSSAATMRAWYGEHRMGFLVGNYLGIAAFFPGFVQLAVLAARVRRMEGEAGWLSSLVLGSGSFTYAVFACSLVVFQLYPFLLDARLDGPTEVMGMFGSIWFALDGLAAIPFILSVGWATVRVGALPRWFGPVSWLTALLGFLMSLGSIFISPAWLAAGGLVTGMGFFAFFAWTFAIGVIFLRLQPQAH